VKNVAFYRVPEAIFHAIAAALFGEDVLKISYHSPYKNETTERIIRPLHLLCYMGNWHLIAFCSLRKQIRDFAVSRILAVHPSAETLSLPPDLPPIKEYLRRNFGVMAGGNPTFVALRFSPAVSPLIAEQEWFEAQEVSVGQDGSLNLRFPVSGQTKSMICFFLQAGPKGQARGQWQSVAQRTASGLQAVFRTAFQASG